MKSVKDLVIGDFLLDMHHFPRESKMRIVEPHKITKKIVLDAHGGSKIIESLVLPHREDLYWSYHNKYLVVVDQSYQEEPEKYIIKAAWSYDGRRLGFMEIEVSVTE